MFAASLSPEARAGGIPLPFFTDLRAEVVDQLAKASNNIAITNDVAGNKKLIKSLNSALKLIDKTKPTYVTGAKALGVLSKSLARTAASNEFNPIIDSTRALYVGSLYGVAEDLQDVVDASYPGRAREAALKAMAKFLAAIDGAETNANIALALKALSSAAKYQIAAAKAAQKADAAPAPPAQITAQVTGALKTSIKTLAAGIVPGAGLVINGAQPAGIGFKQINFSLLNVAEGTSTVNLAFGNINIMNGPSVVNYGNGAGTATVTRNNSNGTAYGTFSFTATGVSGTVGTITVTGEFFGTFPF